MGRFLRKLRKRLRSRCDVLFILMEGGKSTYVTLPHDDGPAKMQMREGRFDTYIA